MKYKAIAANSKIYFGKDIPNMFMDYAGSQSKFAEGLAEGIHEEDGAGPSEDTKLLHNTNWKETFILVLYQKKHELGSSFLFSPFPVLKEIKFNPLNLLYDN